MLLVLTIPFTVCGRLRVGVRLQLSSNSLRDDGDSRRKTGAALAAVSDPGPGLVGDEEWVTMLERWRVAIDLAARPSDRESVRLGRCPQQSEFPFAFSRCMGLGGCKSSVYGIALTSSFKGWLAFWSKIFSASIPQEILACGGSLSE